VISGFRSEVDEYCALLGCYAACRGNFLPTFRDNLSGPIFKDQILKIQELWILEDGTNKLSRNVGKKLPLLDEQIN
jgi:predicted P-loop ATPase